MNVQESIDWSQILVSGNRMFIGSNAAVPRTLMKHLVEHSQGLSDIELVHILTLDEPFWVDKKYQSLFKINSLFLGAGVRDAVAEGYADYTPCFLSEIPSLFSDQTLALDVALIMVSPPDKLGYCSFGVSVDVVSAAAKAATIVVAHINPQMPRTGGQSFIHISEIDHYITIDEPIIELEQPFIDTVTEQIGQYVSLLIEDGDTLQLGIGKIPDAVLRYLTDHKDLGVHTEMFSDGLIELVKSGVVNNSKKTFHPGKTVTSFCMGSKALYDFVDNNPHIEFHPSEYVNAPANIIKNDNMVSINSAIEVDLTGQVVSDSIGYRFYSGIGGQVDFIRGASMSKGGKPIIALPSTTKDGSVSRITACLTEGSGVVTSRGDVHYIVTEYGIATLRGKSIRERALELIKIAHPKFREELLTQVRQHMRVPHYQTQTPKQIPELGKVSEIKLNLRKQKFTLRPLSPSDERHLQEFFYSHKKETLMMRYNYRPTRMSPETSSSLVAVDQSKDIALCITSTKSSHEKIHAVGRYYLIEKDNTAEVAFVVREEQQGKGMAKTLLSYLVKIAQARNINALVAFTRKDNKPMQTLFLACGFQVVKQDMDEIHFELKLLSEKEEEAVTT